MLPPGHNVPKGKIAMGNPARVVKDVDENTKLYNQIGVNIPDLALRCINGLTLIKE